ncbi:hypothetical protein KO116_03151 [Halomonas sp. KO116]|nr:hypothetical protein KO116_03151 [Halomonas sp. KO116]
MDTVRTLAGIQLDDERLEHVINAYRPILNEIEKLRTLNLNSTYPAVHFSPLAAYSAEDKNNE